MIEFPTIPSDAHYKKDLNDCTAGDLENLINIRKKLHEVTGVEHSAECLDADPPFRDHREGDAGAGHLHGPRHPRRHDLRRDDDPAHLNDRKMAPDTRIRELRGEFGGAGQVIGPPRPDEERRNPLARRPTPDADTRSPHRPPEGQLVPRWPSASALPASSVSSSLGPRPSHRARAVDNCSTNCAGIIWFPLSFTSRPASARRPGR